MPLNRDSETGKELQGVQVAEECVSELFGRARMLLARPIEYLLHIC